MPKEILVLKHIDIEGPGSMEDFFRNTAWNLRVIDLSAGELRSKDVADVVAIISLGGPMNVYEDDKYPFLKDEDKFLRKAIREETPVLGICLGAQLLARAFDAKVKKAPGKEIGWYKVNLTNDGRRDPLFENLPLELDVFQWHQDSFEIPKGAALLAESLSCPNQAFRFGRNAYGLQFHIEVTPEMVESWIDNYIKKEAVEFNPKDMLIESYKRKETFRRQADIVYFNFARVIAESQKRRGVD
ncbi:MAG: type 1 glutamine amidotransferase [Candidatus Omnitrophica bacterium]|nr:type 1 glutamine amidotransferase [Candidatus Omnitrophota bacterium]